MAFMFVTTVLVVAICRIHTKRATVTIGCPMRHQNPRLPSQSLSALPLYNFDLFTQDSGLLVTYNINNGVQFVGRPVDPPPYCEIMDRPPREGPPPPYVSRENITAPEITAEAAQPHADTQTAAAKKNKITPTALNLKRESRSDGNIATARHSSDVSNVSADVFSSLKDFGVDDGVNIYVNRLCESKKTEQKPDVDASKVAESDDDVSYTENDSLLTAQNGTDSTKGTDSRKLRGYAPGRSKRPSSLVLPSGNRRGKNSRAGLAARSGGGGDVPGAPASCDYLTRRSLGDLSPSSESFSFDGDVVTLPLRESFIGVRDGEGK